MSSRCLNLQAQIDGLERQAAAKQLAVSGQAELIALVIQRGHVLGRISDYEWTEELAEQLTRDAQDDGEAFLAHAQVRGTFHRFTDALTDLDEAQRLGAEPTVMDAERAAVFQAIGRYDDALAIYGEAAERRGNFHSIGALAVLHAERGEVDAAERLFRRKPETLPGGLAVSAGIARLPARTDVDDGGRSSTAPVSGSAPRIAACQPMLPCRAIWPRSRRPWESLRPQSRVYSR